LETRWFAWRGAGSARWRGRRRCRVHSIARRGRASAECRRRQRHAFARRTAQSHRRRPALLGVPCSGVQAAPRCRGAPRTFHARLASPTVGSCWCDESTATLPISQRRAPHAHRPASSGSSSYAAHTGSFAAMVRVATARHSRPLTCSKAAFTHSVHAELSSDAGPKSEPHGCTRHTGSSMSGSTTPAGGRARRTRSRRQRSPRHGGRSMRSSTAAASTRPLSSGAHARRGRQASAARRRAQQHHRLCDGSPCGCAQRYAAKRAQHFRADAWQSRRGARRSCVEIAVARDAELALARPQPSPATSCG